MDKNKFQVGDWIIEKYYSRVGYVTSVNPEKELCEVQMVRNIDGSKNDTEGTYRWENLKMLPPMIHKEDLHSLQHVAVLWKDPEWFKELAERKGK